MELEHILKLIDAVSESSLTNFSLEDGDVKLSLGVDRNSGAADGVAYRTVVVSGADTEIPHQETAAGEHVPHTDNGNVAGNVVASPLVGIFYSAASPEEEPFVKVGDTVKKGQTLGIVEAMKLMNEIESEYDGTVKQILIDNEQMVEYGQPMFIIE